MGLERRPELRDFSVRTQRRNWPGVLFEGEGHGEGRKQGGASCSVIPAWLGGGAVTSGEAYGLTSSPS